jgi:hypothetical protein
MRYNCAPFSSFIQQQPLKPHFSLNHTRYVVPSLTPTVSAVRPTTAQQVPTYTLMAQDPEKKLWAVNSHKNLPCHGHAWALHNPLQQGTQHETHSATRESVQGPWNLEGSA